MRLVVLGVFIVVYLNVYRVREMESGKCYLRD